MRHGVKKTKFHKGRDSHRALVRKLVLNFIEHGKLETTLKRAQVVKSTVDSLTYKSLTSSESNKNVLLRQLGDVSATKKMLNEIGPAFKTGTGGFVRLIKLGQRQGDNAEVAQLTWTKNFTPKAQPTGKSTKNDGKANKQLKSQKKEN